MIDRRTVLKGFGAALALPYLESLSTISYASAPKVPLRTAFILYPMV